MGWKGKESERRDLCNSLCNLLLHHGENLQWWPKMDIVLTLRLDHYKFSACACLPYF